MLGPFLRRELIVSARRGSTYGDRVLVAVVTTLLVAGVVVVWDWNAWDRVSGPGMQRLGLWAFAIVIAAEAVLGLGMVVGAVSPGVALERDRKTLDALLATRLSSVEIVLGMLAAGLVKALAGLSAALPLLVLIVFQGGVDPLLLVLTCAGLLTTAVALGALAVAASVAARSAQGALGAAMTLAMTWLIGPIVLVLILPRIWPAAARLVAPVSLGLLQSSPLGPLANVVGLFRRVSLPGAVLRMIALQALGASVLILWSIWRLRPASRALYDGEGRAALLRTLRRRSSSRPACGDDPVLWNEIHSTRGTTFGERLAHRLVVAIMVGSLCYLASWFAVPAFAELAERGYGAAAGKGSMPELHPLARMLVVKLSKVSAGLAPGQARLEFNIVLRQASAMLVMVYVLMIAAFGAESVGWEKERDTWLGLIATPLSGREILRAKMWGAAWRGRGLSMVLVGLWTVGLVAGALHPLGFLAALGGLAINTWFFAALGVYVSLWSSDRKEATSRILLPAMLPMSGLVLPFLPHGFASVMMAIGSSSFHIWALLLSYEDVAAAIGTGAFPQLASVGVHSGEGAGRVLTVVLIGLSGLLIGAPLLTRAAYRGFDSAVGRPRQVRRTPTRGALREVVVMPAQPV